MGTSRQTEDRGLRRGLARIPQRIGKLSLASPLRPTNRSVNFRQTANRNAVKVLHNMMVLGLVVCPPLQRQYVMDAAAYVVVGVFEQQDAFFYSVDESFFG
jgi:hypothetical protein